MRILLPCLLLAACASTPSITSDIATATQLNTAALTAAVSLAQSGALTSKQLTEVYGVTNAVEAALVVAEQASNAGNAGTAQTTYTAIMSTIGAITACLAAKSPASTIDGCVAGVPAP